MAAPATPVIRGAQSFYQPTDSINLTWTSGLDTVSSEVKVYVDGTLSATQSATGQAGAYGTIWTWTATASSLTPAGSTVTVMATVTNLDSTSAPASVTFGVYDAPTVTLTPAQGATIGGLPLIVSWSVDDPTGVSRQVMRVFSSSSVVYATDYTPSMALTPDERSRTIHAADMLTPMESGTAYKVRITVTNGVGLVTTVTHDISVSWVAPIPPTLTNTEADPDTSSVLVRADAPLCDIVVWRVIDGERVVVGSGYEHVDSVDVLPPLGVDVTYEAVATDHETGAVSSTNSRTVLVKTTKWTINYGVNAEEIVQLVYNPKSSYQVEHGGAAYHFADGGAGEGLPVYYSTTDREMGGSLSWDTLTQATADRLNALMLRHPVGWLRDPLGHRWRAHMTPKFSHGVGRVWQVSIDWDAVRWVEV